MICPYCNAQISDGTKFCENCGSALLVDTPITSPVEPTASKPHGQTVAQPAQPAQSVYQQPAYGAPGQQAQQQPYTATGQPYGQSAPVSPMQQYASAQQPSTVPFVLAIIALVCAIVGLFPVSFVLAIVALAMNSGQKKRGEFSTKQTPTFVMGIISLILSILVAITIFVLGAAVITAAQNGEAGDIDDFIEEVITPQTAGSSATAGAAGAISSSYVGIWEIDSMYTDGEAIDSEDIELMQSMGMNVILELNADGTASLDMFGEELTGGTWKDLGSGNLSLELEGESASLTYDGVLLTLRDGSDWLSFRKV